MKTRITLLFLLLSVLTQAQENYMSLSFGIGNPMFEYAKSESLASDGFAVKGFMADYSGAYYLKNHFGIGGSIKFNQNTLNYSAAKTELLKLVPEGAELDSTAELNMGYWSVVSFGVGPQFTFPIGSILNFDVYVFPGLHIVTAPKMEFSTIVDDETRIYGVTSQNVRFGFEAGASLRISLGSNTGLRIFASCLRTSSKGEISEMANDNLKLGSSSFKRPIRILNTGIGLVIGL